MDGLIIIGVVVYIMGMVVYVSNCIEEDASTKGLLESIAWPIMPIVSMVKGHKHWFYFSKEEKTIYGLSILLILILYLAVLIYV